MKTRRIQDKQDLLELPFILWIFQYRWFLMLATVAGLYLMCLFLSVKSTDVIGYSVKGIQLGLAEVHNRGELFYRWVISQLVNNNGNAQWRKPDTSAPLELTVQITPVTPAPRILDSKKQALSSTDFLGQQSSPFATYGEATRQNSLSNMRTEIRDFFELRHNEYKYVDMKYFLRHADGLLPKYQHLFRKAGQKYNLDWRLVAAIAYQESKWNPDAVSPTGVRGMMMLTRVTAKEMGVKDRTDVVESIFGGAAYFRKLLDRIPTDVKGADRVLMALASYNMGYGHLDEARKITKKQNGDPSLWADVVKRVPLLQKSQFYEKSPYGFAKGARQAVHYVGEVQKHYDMLLMMTEKPQINAGIITPQAKAGFQIAHHGRS